MPIQPPVIEVQDAGVVSAWYALFIQTCPEFGSTDLYPVATAGTWIVSGVEQLNPSLFGAQFNTAVCLFVAHNMVLSARELKAAAKGTVGGAPTGPIASKSIDKLAIAYDTGAVSTEGAGIYNSTTYGARLLRMIKAFGTGPRYSPYRGRGGRCR